MHFRPHLQNEKNSSAVNTVKTSLAFDIASSNKSSKVTFPKFKIPTTEEPASKPTDKRIDISPAQFQLSDIPNCPLNCVYDHVLGPDKCTPFDYTCICSQLLQNVLWDLRFEKCYRGCDGSQDQIWAPSGINNMCESVHVVPEKYPKFIQTQYFYMNKRQAGPSDSGFSGIASFTDIDPEPGSSTATVTITSTQLHTDVGYVTLISGEENAPTITEVRVLPDPTFFEKMTTTTLPPGVTGFTSIIPNSNGGDKGGSVIVGVANPTGNPNPPQTSAAGGLSTGAKIGIGVTIPLVLLVLFGIGIFFFLRRRKQKATVDIPQEQEKDDGGLPENITSIPELPKHTYSPNPVHELNTHGAHLNEPRATEVHATPRQEFNSNELHSNEPRATEVYETPRHELNSNGPYSHSHVVASTELQAPTHHLSRPELSANSPPLVQEPMRELSASPPPRYAGITRKAISPLPRSAIPAPWEDGGYEAYQPPTSEPETVRTAEDLEIQRLEEEMAQVSLRKQRLQSLQVLEEREEALKREIEQKRILR